MNRRWLQILTVGLLALSACRITDLPLWTPPERMPNDAEVERVLDVIYYDGAQADGVRHKLDMYLPKGMSDYPVVMLVHGGAWMVGDKNCCGLYPSVAEQLARQGIGVVVPNYRLSPRVKHPEHIKDVARAFAWTKRHIADHGGDIKKLYVVGHSAGGHLVALLATDERYLKAEGCRASDIKGVVGISGVYRIPTGDLAVELGGATAQAIRLDEITPIRGETFKGPTQRGDGIPLRIDIFHPVFGDDAESRLLASPVHHVRAGLPPFLLINADKDLPHLPVMAKQMHEALERAGCKSRVLTLENRNHNTLLFNASKSSDPVLQSIVEFVRR